jgi:hypothetical protein
MRSYRSSLSIIIPHRSPGRDKKYSRQQRSERDRRVGQMRGAARELRKIIAIVSFFLSFFFSSSPVLPTSFYFSVIKRRGAGNGQRGGREGGALRG